MYTMVDKVETFTTYQKGLKEVTEKIKGLAEIYDDMEELERLYQDMRALSDSRLKAFKYFMYDSGHKNGMKESLKLMTKAVETEKERLEKIINDTV